MFHGMKRQLAHVVPALMITMLSIVQTDRIRKRKAGRLNAAENVEKVKSFKHLSIGCSWGELKR